jgi:hypothetical protein
MFPSPTQSPQLDLLAEGLLPIEKDHHAIYGELSKFLLFYLVVCVAFKEKSSAWSQHKTDSD